MRRFHPALYNKIFNPPGETVLRDLALPEDFGAGFCIGLDAGGTSFKLIAVRRREVVAQGRVATTEPEATLAQTKDWVSNLIPAHGVPKAIGIGSFGPIELSPDSPNYGEIGRSPKQSWQGVSIANALKNAFPDTRVALNTDVNAALLGEMKWGAARGAKNAAYATVGTGIGVGLCVNGKLVGSKTHPEIGHIRPRRAPKELSSFKGVCPYHGDCLEGLASGPSMQARWGVAPHLLLDNERAWDIEAWYLAELCATLTYVARPDMILLGGGICAKTGLIENVREQFTAAIGGYAFDPARVSTPYISAPRFGSDAGQIGALSLIA